MIDFFIKRSKVVLDCFTDNLNAFDYFPIKDSNNFYPEWWKAMPKTDKTTTEVGIETERATIKTCDGIIALYQQGFMIPLWSDLILETHENGFKYTFADETSHIGNHDYEQTSREFLPYIHFKLYSPWVIRSTKDVQFYFTQPSYNHVQTLTAWHVLPGVVDFKYQHATNVNFVAPRNKRFQMTAGMPLAHLIPLTDKEIELKLHMIDPTNIEDLRMKNSFYPFFTGSYKKMKRIINEKEKNSSKCPFFGGRK
jgi:hypothetical protein